MLNSSQYPDSVSIVIPDVLIQDTATGRFVVSVPGSTVVLDCRGEAKTPVSKGNADGLQTDYSFMIYMEPMTTVIPEGSAFTLTKESGLVFTGKVKGFAINQFNTVLWG